MALERDASVDDARARELYKYFRPPAVDGGLPDTVLAAHAQLVAWRLDAERSMITLIDEETQYFVAESTKTLHLDDNNKHDHPCDAIWAGCVRVPMAGRLCEHTLATLPPPDGGPACFEVLDLSKDERFNQLDFVKGTPHFRNYVGVPLRTRKGINIGSLFVIDSRIRPPLTKDERHFLGTMATNIIQHLEMNKEKRDNQRTVNMQRYLSTYVDPEFQRQRHMKSPSRTVGVKASSATLRSDHSDNAMDGAECHEVFTPAAELLKEALDLEEGGGGVVFLDTVTSLGRSQPFAADTDKSETSSGPESDPEESVRYSRSIPKEHPSSPDRRPQAQNSRTSNMFTEVLAHASYPVPKRNFSRLIARPFTALSPQLLSKLIKRYPRGKLFTLDKEGHIVSSTDDDKVNTVSSPNERSHRVAKSHSEVKALRAHFPMARQIIFLPLWDPTTSRSSACFVYNCSEYRHFSRNAELLYCITFTNCVMTEIGRLAAVKSDQQKSDFIGSISHELRSPLHGILASCEFLGETECSTFQRSLVSTADSCARTLLDTINMVLDYSNINTFEKKQKKSRRSRQGAPRTNSPSGTLQADLSVYQHVDIAAITEEVVDGVATGHTFSSMPNTPDGDLPQAQNGKCNDTKASLLLMNLSGNKDVELIIDIPARDWTYWSQPGALRRIIMNLVGNSLKYTKQGFVLVKVDAHEDYEHPTFGDSVTLTVTDSGQGMSAAYMKDKLFTPFAQESSLTPGTGLGLSLVKSIVRMLDGTIGVESSVGVGTKVTVELPMTRGAISSNGHREPTNHANSVVERVKDDSLEAVKKQVKKRSIAIYSNGRRGNTKSQHEAIVLMRKSLETYLREWCGFKVRPWNKHDLFDIIISEQSNVQDLMVAAPQLFTAVSQSMVLVLCDTVTAQNLELANISSQNLQQLCYPVGPHKFARALKTCFEHLEQGEKNGRGAANLVMCDQSEAKAMTLAEAVSAALGNISISPKNCTSSESEIIETHIAAMQNGSINGRIATKNRASVQAEDPVTLNTVPSGSFLLDSDDDPRSPSRSSLTAEKALYQSSDTPKPRKKPPPIPPKRKNVSTTTTKIAPIPPAKPQYYQPRQPRQPRMLLVDDNTINLRLLQVFMKKRNYTSVLTAPDGQQAVDAYRRELQSRPPVPPDIILMDISMPVLNGFEATRQIRRLEDEYNARLKASGNGNSRKRAADVMGDGDRDGYKENRGSGLGNGFNVNGYGNGNGNGNGNAPTRPIHALIVALTGLASVRDQKEAFVSGADVYMMKPASFARLAAIMDKWEREGGGLRSVIV